MQQEYVTFAFLAQFGLNCNSNIYHSNQDFQIFKEHMPLCMENGSFVYKRLRDLSVYYCDLSGLRLNCINFGHSYSKTALKSNNSVKTREILT
jgi:hypothetical protein